MKHFLKISLMALLLAALTSCGSYIVSADNLKELHIENSILAGSYIDQNLRMKIEDGDNLSDKICLSESNQRMIGKIYYLPNASETIVVISDISSIENERPTKIEGDLIYYVKSANEKLMIYDPITNAIDLDVNVPFVRECKDGLTGQKTTLSSYKMQPFCLNSSVTKRELYDWFSTNSLGESLAEFRLIKNTNRSKEAVDCF